MFGLLAIDVAFHLSTEASGKTYLSYVEDLKQRLESAYKLAGTSVEKAQAHQKRQYDTRARGGSDHGWR